MTSPPILTHFDPNLPVEVHTDASVVGVGAILIQKNDRIEQVVAYANKALNAAQKNYGATELELYAIIFAVEKFKYYLSNSKTFKIITDHSAISSLLKIRNPTGRLAR